MSFYKMPYLSLTQAVLNYCRIHHLECELPACIIKTTHFNSKYKQDLNSKMIKNMASFKGLSVLLSISLLIALSSTQQPEIVKQEEDFVEPIVVTPDNQIPAEQIQVDENIPNPTINNVQPPQQPSNNRGNPNPIPGDDNIPKIPSNAPSGQQDATPNQITQEQKRLARQAAIKARQMAQTARKQAEQDRKAREQKEEEEIERIKMDVSMNKTDKQKQTQRLKFRKQARNVEQGTKFTEYLFEMGAGVSEFFIQIPATQQVAINFYTYIAQNNTYVRTKNVEEDDPISVYIYENNNRITFQGDFFYQMYAVFEGKAEAVYMIRVVNKGKNKLVSMSTKKLLEKSHIDETISTSEGSGHVIRTQNLAVQVNRWYQDFRKLMMLDFQDIKQVEGHIKKYWSFEIIETIVAVVLCALQVKMIQKLLTGNSIV